MEELKKFAIEPGLMTLEEIEKVKEFILEYIKIRDEYKEVFVVDPIGLTLESKLDSINWYVDFIKNKEIK